MSNLSTQCQIFIATFEITSQKISNDKVLVHFRSEKYGKIKSVQVNHLVVVGTRNVDAVFYKSLDNTNILLLDYYNAEIEYEKPYVMFTVHKHLQLIL